MAQGTAISSLSHTSTRRSLATTMPSVAILAAAAAAPFFLNQYWILIASRIAIYWVLVSSLNLLVGFAGQLAIGYVALLTLGAYVTSVLAAGNVLPPLPAFVALAVAGGFGAVFGVVVGLPALRLRTFYFAMTTMGFATIVTQIALAWEGVTGGGFGLAGPQFPSPFDSAGGFYGLCLGLAALCTFMTANVARGRIGRDLVVTRDAEVAAEASGISKARLLLPVFVLTGATAAVAGGLFAGLQTYITPDAFTFDLSLLFFSAVVVGGRGSIIGPLLGTVVLTLLPEFVSALQTWATLLHSVLLLAVVLLAPGGIASLLGRRSRAPIDANRAIMPRVSVLDDVLGASVGVAGGSITLNGIQLRFGSVQAIDGVDLVIEPGRVHGLIGPNGSGKTTTLNVISGYYRPQAGSVTLGAAALRPNAPVERAGQGIARTFQTPRVTGEATALDNVLVGASLRARASFVEILLGLGRNRRDEAEARAQANLALRAVGLEAHAGIRADRLQHTELRFLEIARALMLRPRFLLLDEPAAGLSPDEVLRLGHLIKEVSQRGVGVLLVEHHADLVFGISDVLTVLNLGKVLAQGTPAEIRSHKDVIHAYLGQ